MARICISKKKSTGENLVPKPQVPANEAMRMAFMKAKEKKR